MSTMSMSQARRRLMLYLRITIIVMSTRRTLRTNIRRIRIVKRFLYKKSVQQVQRVRILRFNMNSNVLISRVLTRLKIQILVLKTLHNQGTVSRNPVRVEANRNVARIIVRRMSMMLTILRQKVMLRDS